MEQDKAPRRKASTMPFIMPDGRPLSVFLTETNQITQTHHRRSGKRRGRAKEPAHGWSSSSRPSVSNANESSQQPRSSRDLTDAELTELACLEKVGVRRQRRWLNDKLLRDMAPPLTAKDMESLFKPAPFGDTGYVSAFTLAAAPEHAPLWDLFRSVDSDKQNRVLLKWEAHVKELRAEVSNNSEGGCGKKADSAVLAATTALNGWAAVGPRGRKALRRAPRGCAEELEAPILRLLENPAENEVVMELDDGFQRLLAHSLAKFHSLYASSRDSPDGGREVVVRKRRNRGENVEQQQSVRNKSKIPQRRENIHNPSPAPAAAVDPTGTTRASAASPSSSTEIPSSPAVANTTAPVGSGGTPSSDTANIPRITCVDILWLLDDGVQHVNGGLTAKTLKESLGCHDHGSMMEMEHVHSHHQPNAVSPVAAA